MSSPVRRLSRRGVEQRAYALLARYEARFGVIEQPPVPVDSIAELLLGFTVEMYDLRGQYGSDAVLAEVSISKRRIRIDESLDPVEHPEREGTYGFSLAHEIAHIVCHQGMCEPDIPEAIRTPSLTERYSSRSPIEWQADVFAAALLMPPRLVKKAWLSFHGDPSPLTINAEMEAAGICNLGSREAFVSAVCENAAREMAKVFRVSVKAMQIRLESLGLLATGNR